MLIFQNMPASVFKSKITHAMQNLQLKLLFRNPKHMASRCPTRPCHAIGNFYFAFKAGKRS